MLRRLASRLYWKRYLSRNACPWTELAEFPKLPPAEQKREMVRRLRAQLEHFAQRDDALPEWREAARIQSPDDFWRAWGELPIIGKRELSSRFNPRELQRKYGLDGRLDSTGGSTGEPVFFFHDKQMQFHTHAAVLFARYRAGWRPGTPKIGIWGSERDIGKDTARSVRLQNTLLYQFIVDGYHIHRGTVERVLDLIRSHGPVCIYGFTSLLEFLARETIAMGARPPAGAVQTGWVGGEMLFDTQKELFRQAFGVPLINVYGGRELGAIAGQEGEHDPLWVLRPWVFVEVVDDRGRPVQPGESGRLVCTHTVGRGTPFLRYEVGDLGVSAPEHDRGAGVAGLSEIQGRIASLLELPDGRKINNIFWNHMFKEFPEVHQFQVTLKKDDSLSLLFTGDGFQPHREEHVRRVFANFLGAIPVRFTWVDRIPLTSQGKLVQVIREPKDSPEPAGLSK